MEKADYFRACLKDGGLAMKPFCRCGQQLNEDYHCPTCDRDCRCTSFVCADEKTMAAVQCFVDEQPSFAGFELRLAGDSDN